MKRQLNFLVIVTGLLGLSASAFMALVYYSHLLNLPADSIGAIQYEVSAHSTAAILLSVSLALGLSALAFRNERKSCSFMLFSAFMALLGYLSPCERLFRLGYIDALISTLILAFFNVFLLLSSAMILHKIHKKLVNQPH